MARKRPESLIERRRTLKGAGWQAGLKQKQSVTSRLQGIPQARSESSDRLSPQGSPSHPAEAVPPRPPFGNHCRLSQSRPFCECVGVSSSHPSRDSFPPLHLLTEHTPSHVHHPGRPSLVWKLWSSAAPESCPSCHLAWSFLQFLLCRLSLEQVRRAVFQTRTLVKTLSMENSPVNRTSLSFMSSGAVFFALGTECSSAGGWRHSLRPPLTPQTSPTHRKAGCRSPSAEQPWTSAGRRSRDCGDRGARDGKKAAPAPAGPGYRRPRAPRSGSGQARRSLTSACAT